MKSFFSSFDSDSLRMVVAIFFVVIGVYLAIRNFPVHPELVNYFFPILILFAGLYWLTAFFIFDQERMLLPGLLFFVLGFFMVLSRWELVPALSVSWPLLLGCIGGALWLNAKSEGFSSWPLGMLTIVGIILYISQMSWFSLHDILRYWPILFVAIGIYLLLKSKKHPVDQVENEE